MPLLLLFIIIPIIEIFLFIEIGERIGVGWTIAIVLATAFIGTGIVRKQGLEALTKAQVNLEQNRLPMEEVFTGLCLLVAGALLLTPGFLTDAMGFVLLIPPFRKTLGATIWGWIKNNGHIQMRSRQFGQNTGFNSHSTYGFTKEQSDIIDGEFEEVNPQHHQDDPHKKINSDHNKTT